MMMLLVLQFDSRSFMQAYQKKWEQRCTCFPTQNKFEGFYNNLLFESNIHLYSYFTLYFINKILYINKIIIYISVK